MTDFETLARAHQARQVREAAAVQAALARYWDDIVDPADFDRTFARFQATAARLIGTGRIRSEGTAQKYYELVFRLADLDGVPASVVRRDLETQATTAALAGAVRSDTVSRSLAAGADPNPLMSAAKVAALRSAKRRTLDAGRQRLVAISATDRHMRGWARVSDGKPCAFCGMLASRGPVYTSATARFSAHDGCGCSVRLVPRSDPSGGWSEDARRLSGLWEKAGDPITFRQMLEGRYKPPSTPTDS